MSEPGKDNSRDRLEPTIVPVRRPVGDDSDRLARVGGGLGRRLLIAAATLLVLVGLLAVFVYLPARMERPAPPAATVAAAPAEPVVETPVLSAAEVAALTEQAENLLAELLEQQQALAARSAASWGDTTWSTYENAARLGDDAFLDEDLTEAVSQYQTALDIGEALLARSEDIVAEALAAADLALASGDAELAESQYRLVLAIDPDNAGALAGLDRAAVLPDVIAAMRRGDQSDERGELEQAAAAYREALAIDGAYTAARRALEDVNRRIASARFESLITAGYAAMDERRYELAAEQFNAALALRPGSRTALDGLAEAEQGLELDAIAMAEIRGMAFERRERWNDAIARYQEALATDPTLAFAIEGLERSQERADLDVKLEALLARPRLLLTEAGLQDARLVLDEALAIPEPGPRLSAQTERLDRLIEAALTPISVTLISDNATEVTVYRVGELGTFDSKEIDLKPGSYTAVGQRRGYRDVRENFTVLPGADNGPVTVICMEPI